MECSQLEASYFLLSILLKINFPIEVCNIQTKQNSVVHTIYNKFFISIITT